MSPRIWWKVAVTGVALVVLAMVVVALVLYDKEHFGWMAGSTFLMTISSGVMVGSVVLLIGAWKLPQRWRWQGITLMLWALIALTSPAFGYLFLLPWGVLLVALPVVIAALVTARGTEAAPVGVPDGAP